MSGCGKLIGALWLLLGLIMVSPVLGQSEDSNSADDYRNLELFTDVLSLIRGSYVEEVETTELIRGAIRGMLETLDPHSSFLNPEMFEEMQVDTHGEFGGLGVEITIRAGDIIVVSPIEDTPADKAGIRAGDRIVEIEGRSTQDMDIMEAVKLMRGRKGEPVSLALQRNGENELLRLTIVRDLIQIESVKSRMLDDYTGYIRISQFQDRTAQDLTRSLEILRQQHSGFNGLILDLRNNPGGLLDQAVAVADLFIADGLIVYTEGRDVEAQYRFSAHEQQTEPVYPLVVLINGGSASAAEIVAGALQDHKRAIILGEQSFGKGSVQTIIPLGDQSGLRLTTAKYYTPAGRSIQARGITPDIHIPALMERQTIKESRVREVDLDNHFQPQTQMDKDRPITDVKLEEDYQLQRAVELLKGFDLLSRIKAQDK